MIALLISVRDEAQFIHANIQHHLEMGIDRFVFTEICSSDGTRELLQTYEKDPRFHITYLDDQYPRKYPWKRVMVDIAKKHFGATWMISIDADELLLPKSGDLKKEMESISGHGCRINRYNVALSEQITFQDYYRTNSLFNSPVVAKTNPLTRAYLKEGKPFPWILGPIDSKVIARADCVEEFTPGGHGVFDGADDERFETIASNLIILHFPFTTYQRFRNKISNIADFEKMVREINRERPETGWQWHRWVRIFEQGEDALKAEFDRQIIGRKQLSNKKRNGTIRKARSVFNMLAKA